MLRDDLDSLTNEIQQGFMQPGGRKACRYLLQKLVDEKTPLEAEAAAMFAVFESCLHALESEDCMYDGEVPIEDMRAIVKRINEPATTVNNG